MDDHQWPQPNQDPGDEQVQRAPQNQQRTPQSQQQTAGQAAGTAQPRPTQQVRSARQAQPGAERVQTQEQAQRQPRKQMQRPQQAARSTQARRPSQQNQQSQAQRQAQAQARRQTQTQRVQQAKRVTQEQTHDQAQRAQERKRTQQPRRSTGQGVQVPALSQGKGLFGQGMSRTTLIAAIAAIAVAVIAWFATGGFGLRNAPETPPEEPVEQTSAPTIDQQVDQAIANLTLEQKISQMFIVTPEELTSADVVVAAGDVTRLAISDRPVGGIVYFEQNLQDPSQVREMLSNTQTYSRDTCGLPMFLAVDEEGGEVTRVASNWNFEVEDVGYMSDIGAAGDVEAARLASRQIGSYLAKLGFNTDFAPVADISFDPWGTMGARSFGDSADMVAPMVEAAVKGFNEAGIVSCAKHFPGIGAAEGDSHYSAIYTSRTQQEMQEEEFKPFQAAIAAGVPMVMVGHITATELTGDDTPASLSKTIVTDILRSQLGFNGVVVTDSLSMGAVTELYSSEEAAVAAIQAGVDIVLMPENFDAAYRGVLSAVQSGQISEDRINESLRRIVKAKLDLQQASVAASGSVATSPEDTQDSSSNEQAGNSTAQDQNEQNESSDNLDSPDETMTDMSGGSVTITEADPADNSITSAQADAEGIYLEDEAA